MDNVIELIKWAKYELKIDDAEINMNSKILLIECINNKKTKYLKYFETQVWNKELIDRYINNIENEPVKLNLSIDLKNYYLTELLKKGYYNFYVSNCSTYNETPEMMNLFFSNLENAAIDWDILRDSSYCDDAKKTNLIIKHNRLDLLVGMYSSRYNEETFKLLEGRMLELNFYHKFYGKKIDSTILKHNNYKLFMELIDNGDYEYIDSRSLYEFKDIFEDEIRLNKLTKLFEFLDDDDKYNRFYTSKVHLTNEFLNIVLKCKKINYFNSFCYLFDDDTFTKENQILLYNLQQENENIYKKRTNYSEYIESYYNKPNNDYLRVVNYTIDILDNIETFRNFDKVYTIGGDIINNKLHIEDAILRRFYEFIYETSSPRILKLIIFLIDSKLENLNKLFTKDNITDYFKENLKYDQDYILYCFKNNVDILSDLKNINMLLYYKLISKYKDITKFIVFMDNNIDKYIYNGEITREFIAKLFNSRGYKTLLLMLDNKEPLELSELEKYILNKTNEIEDNKLKDIFISYCLDNIEQLTIQKIDKVTNIIERVIYNNSDEIRKKSSEIINSIINKNNLEEELEKLEDIFDNDNIPEFGKRYVIYKMIYSNDLKRENISSNIYKKMTDEEINKTVLYDLFMIQLQSYDEELINYIDELGKGERLYLRLRSGSNKIDKLTNEEIEILNNYKHKLEFIGKHIFEFELNNSDNDFNFIEKFENKLKEKINFPQNMPLPMMLDTVISLMFGDYGITSIIQLEMLIHKSIILKTAYEEGRKIKNLELKIEDGDFLKAVNSKYLDNILKYGSVCKEMLGEDASRDFTHMDTDLSIIKGENLTIRNVLAQKNDANSGIFGDIKLLLSKKYMNFNGNTIITDDNVNINDKNMFEIFRLNNKETAYGIRTGFPSTFISAIIANDNVERIKFSIVKNGFYIPIYNNDGELIFTYNDYLKLSKQKSGLKRYHDDDYKLSENLETSEIKEIAKTLKNNEIESSKRRNAIYEKLNKVFYKYFNKVKYKLDKNISEGLVEIFDTGSTGRGTNVFNDSDFDFILRVDKRFKNSKLFPNFVSDIYKVFGINGSNPNIRIENIKFDEIGEDLDIDITIINKTNKINYSTDVCIRDRLNTIKEKYPDKYDLVVANIIAAKNVLKKAKAYKPKHARKNPQGGLGGVGVENWILQNNGSLYDASKSFISVAENTNFNFKKFQAMYPIYDFGENHLAVEKNKYLYDNFIYNMSDDGFKLMIEALKEFINKYEEEKLEILVQKHKTL